MLPPRVCLTVASGASALETGIVERQERKCLRASAALPHMLFPLAASFLTYDVMLSSQDDFCILLSKNIEPEERKQAFPSFSSDAASHAAAQAASAVETIQNY